jgi:hypothetical protein
MIWEILGMILEIVARIFVTIVLSLMAWFHLLELIDRRNK